MQHHYNIAVTNFMITGTKLYAPVDTLSSNDNIVFSENI